MRNKIIAAIMVVVIGGFGLASLFGLTGCASCSRACVDLKSDISGGLDRIINVYTANGDLIATYSGLIDIDANDGGYIKFDLDGKRYIYYNCFVETIANID